MKVKFCISIFLIIIICMFSLCGCQNVEGIESLAYAVAIGIDKGDNNRLKLSLQFALLSDSSDSGGR